jgi:hypothetical protein
MHIARQAFVAILVVGLGAIALAASRIPEICPLDWSGAQRVDVTNPYSSADLIVNGRTFRVGGSALLDYMPRGFSGPLVRLGPAPHPLNVNLSVSGPTRADLEGAAVTCVRATHGAESWSRRPQNYEIQSPQWDAPGDSWRNASAQEGPDWPAGDAIGLEAWVIIAGHRFVLVYAPFELMKGL